MPFSFEEYQTHRDSCNYSSTFYSNLICKCIRQMECLGVKLLLYSKNTDYACDKQTQLHWVLNDSESVGQSFVSFWKLQILYLTHKIDWILHWNWASRCIVDWLGVFRAKFLMHCPTNAAQSWTCSFFSHINIRSNTVQCIINGFLSFLFSFRMDGKYYAYSGIIRATPINHK